MLVFGYIKLGQIFTCIKYIKNENDKPVTDQHIKKCVIVEYNKILTPPLNI